MRLGVIGGRNFTDRKIMWKHLNAWLKKHPKLHIVSGGAPKGADNLAEVWARQKGVPFTIHPAKWVRDDGSRDLGAGFARNGNIAADCETLLAFWDGNSKGTRDTVGKARERGIPVWIVSPEGKITT